MVKLRWIVLAVVAAVVAVVVVRRVFVGDEARIRKRFVLLAECVSKPQEEGLSTLLLKTQRLEGLFADPCVLKIPRLHLTRTFSPSEIVSEAARARTMVDRLQVSFADLDTQLDEDGGAVVTCTARVVADGDGQTRETAEIQCLLQKTDGKWLFAEFSEVQVLER